MSYIQRENPSDPRNLEGEYPPSSNNMQRESRPADEIFHIASQEIGDTLSQTLTTNHSIAPASKDSSVINGIASSIILNSEELKALEQEAKALVAKSNNLATHSLTRTVAYNEKEFIQNFLTQKTINHVVIPKDSDASIIDRIKGGFLSLFPEKWKEYTSDKGTRIYINIKSAEKKALINPQELQASTSNNLNCLFRFHNTKPVYKDRARQESVSPPGQTSSTLIERSKLETDWRDAAHPFSQEGKAYTPEALGEAAKRTEERAEEAKDISKRASKFTEAASALPKMKMKKNDEPTFWQNMSQWWQNIFK